MKAEIIAVGSEIVTGQALDTNSQWISRGLSALGVPVHFHTTLADDLDENVSAIKVALSRADLIIMSGGLGPTQDDLTREALAIVAGVPLIEDAASLEAIAALFARRNRPMPERNRVQALVPQGAEPLPNSIGTAPGIWMQVGGAVVACLPGVPVEMRVMFDEQLVPRLHRMGAAGRVILYHKINLFGRGESDFEADAMDLTVRGRNPEIGITAHEATISFRIRAEGATEGEARQSIASCIGLVRERFDEFIVGEGTDDVAEAVVAQLERTGATLATAESCTGGLVAQMITKLPGVSPFFPGGVVTYSNAAKIELLGVSPGLLETHGAVSAEVAEAMAVGVRRRFAADLGLSVTGIAGPMGGSPQKPVGLVFIGVADGDRVQTRRLEIGPEQPREVIQQRSAKHALNMARLALRSRGNRSSTTHQ